MTDLNTPEFEPEHSAEFIHSATYCIEDNKLRLYPGARLTQEERDTLWNAGFRWAPKQELYVAPKWTPAREDVLIELCGEIDDEDQSPEERSADRAERFGGYRENRIQDARDSADAFDSGPSAFGHQNRARAERQAARHDRHRTRALSHWDTAEYWQRRIRAVISHALHKTSAPVRRSRLADLESEQRAQQKTIDEYAILYRTWQEIGAHPEAGTTMPLDDDGRIDRARMNHLHLKAYIVANTYGPQFEHPRRAGFTNDIWSLMTDNDDQISIETAAQMWLAQADDPEDQTTNINRWARHLANRIAYESAMLEEEGGRASDIDMVPGGFIGKYQIMKVNRSPVTKRVVSVAVWGPHPYRTIGGLPEMGPQTLSIERLSAEAYRAPTEEELADFSAKEKERKAQEKAAAPKTPPLINPTDQDAEKLQAVWNARAQELYTHYWRGREGEKYAPPYQPTAILRITQAEYSARASYGHSPYETVTIYEDGTRGGSKKRDSGAPTCKIRKSWHNGSFSHQAERVIILTDKPQKPLPLDWERTTIEATVPAEVSA